MADLSSHPDFDLDTALSADVDGELDAYAAELGVAPDELRAAVTGPAATKRRAELATVRTALGNAPRAGEELDEVTRRRLLAAAGVGAPSSRPARDRSFLLRAGAAAAVTLVVVVGFYTLTRNSGDSSAKSSESGGGASASTAAPITGDLGDLGDIDGSTVGRLLRGEAPAKSANRSAAPETSRDRAFDSTQNGLAAGSAPQAAIAPQAVDVCVQQYSKEGTIRFRASGTYTGRPAVMLGLDIEHRTIVFVVAADNCTQVLYSASR